MAISDDPRPAMAAIMQRLTGPGGPFELVEEDVLGARMLVFAHRTRSLPDLLRSSLEHGDRDYLVTRDQRITYTEHASMVASLAHALREEYGVGPGDRVGIAAANRPEWILAFWATVSLGAVAVAYNAWWSAREFEYGLAHTRPRVVVADRQRAERIGDSDIPVLTIEDDFERLVDAGPGRALPTPQVAEDDPAVIIYTSGTSGHPKGAVHTHRNLLSVVEFHRLSDALLAAMGDPTDPRDRNHLLAMPLFHIGSLHNLTVTRLATGSKITLYTGAFDADSVLRLIEQERVTNWGAVPTMASRLIAHPDPAAYDTSSLTAFSLSSAPSSPAFQARVRTKLPFTSRMVDSYGLTESCTALSVATPLDLAEAPGTLGAPIPGVRIEIRDPLGTPVAPGVEGEICALSAYNMLGYWEDEVATRNAIGPDRWLHTGDLGRLDEQGRVFLTSRRSDLIIRGGENVYPGEVEALLTEHPSVLECLVHGVQDDDLGQEVAALVVSARGDHEALEAELRAFVTAGIAHYKVPTHWRITNEPLPRNATGKVSRTRALE